MYSLLLPLLMFGLTIETEVSGNASLSGEVVVITVQGFDKPSVDEFRRQFNKASSSGQAIIPIIVDTGGGSVYGLLSIIDMIQSSKIPVATIAEGTAFSAGSVLLACGTKGYRYMSEHSTIMVHEVSSGAVGKVPDMKTDMIEAERLDNLVLSILSKCSGKPPEFFKQEILKRGRADWYITEENAKILGLVDEIGTPVLKVKLDVNMELILNDAEKNPK